MIEEGYAFHADIPYPKESNAERRRFTRRRVGLLLSEFAEQIRFTSEQDESIRPIPPTSFEIAGFVSMESHSLDTVTTILKRCGGRKVTTQKCTIIKKQ